MSEHEGHRLRLIKKLEKGILEEHEVLEALLFNAVPRRNTNDLAHRLIAKFGGIRDMFAASISELQSVDGIGLQVASYIKCIGVFYEKYYAPKATMYEGEFVWENFLAFVKEEYRKVDHEVLDLHFLDKNGKVFTKKRFSAQDSFHVELDPNEVAKCILELQPSGMVVVHNHPHGTAEASETDDQMTVKCQLLCSFHNVLLCDHIIYSKQGVFSYYLSGRMKKISKSYSMQSVIDPFMFSSTYGAGGNDEA